VLVRDDPGLDPARREQQAKRLAEVSAWAAETGRSLILELRVPAAGADTVAVMEYLQDHGVEPALWAIEGLGRHDDAVAAEARRRSRNAYLDYARYYLSAREGMLPAEPDSVL
jgi:myo-inositol catabolism protein IolC